MADKNSTSGKHPLKTSKAEKDLRVVVDSQLNFKDHISQATTKANRILGPCLQQDIEDVQRRATKLIGHLKDKPYSERLSILKLPSLEHRRRRGDMIDLFKYFTGIYDASRPIFELAPNSNTRGHMSLRVYQAVFLFLSIRSLELRWGWIKLLGYFTFIYSIRTIEMQSGVDKECNGETAMHLKERSMLVTPDAPQGKEHVSYI
ncbi:hypothetical protein RRG08_050423 [Elysia crispata]|uniref:Uncharacterized protein n=1 Tax=Elysia crispata TaxID=231223 RepID=A0AAE0ZMS3_9GAST|nr:hypothetical protein RRG08_050423 [Elysia crispata]